jgi:deoxyribodipyrimidine photolyase
MSEGLQNYEGQRQYADARAVSRLSPYLRFGQLSARLLWHKMREARWVGGRFLQLRPW